MFILSIYLAGREQPLYLNFKYRPAAEAARQGGNNIYCFVATDDFGHSVDFYRPNVQGTLVTDLELEHVLYGDMQVMQARAQLKAQQKMAADPALKFAAGLMNGGQQMGPGRGGPFMP